MDGEREKWSAVERDIQKGERKQFGVKGNRRPKMKEENSRHQGGCMEEEKKKT